MIFPSGSFNYGWRSISCTPSMTFIATTVQQR